MNKYHLKKARYMQLLCKGSLRSLSTLMLFFRPYNWMLDGFAIKPYILNGFSSSHGDSLGDDCKSTPDYTSFSFPLGKDYLKIIMMAIMQNFGG